MKKVTAEEIIKLLEAELEFCKGNKGAEFNLTTSYKVGFRAGLEQAIDIVKQTKYHVEDSNETQKEEPSCQYCNGRGHTVVGIVSHEMAIDACEPSMEGQEITEMCKPCKGTGRRITVKDLTNHWRDVAWTYYRAAGAPGMFGDVRDFEVLGIEYKEITLYPKCDKCNETLVPGVIHHCSEENCCERDGNCCN